MQSLTVSRVVTRNRYLEGTNADGTPFCVVLTTADQRRLIDALTADLPEHGSITVISADATPAGYCRSHDLFGCPYAHAAEA